MRADPTILHQSAVEQHGDAADQEHAEEQGDPGDRHDLRDLDRAEAPARIQPIADRRTGDRGETQRMADRIGGEGGQRHAPIGQVPLDVAHADIVVGGQCQVADDGQPGGSQDRRQLELLQILPQLRQAHLAQRAEQQQDGAADQAERQGGAQISGQPMVHAE